jgi:hypothetical protein
MSLKQIKAFLELDGMTKKDFCDFVLLGANSNALNKFLAGKKQDQAGNVVYRRAYAFFEKQRILDSQAKTRARMKNDAEHQPRGFALEAPRTHRLVFLNRM